MRAASGLDYIARAPERHPPAVLMGLAARLCAPRLDRELGAGFAPWHSPLHAVRSLQLTGARSRRSLARTLELLVVRAELTRRDLIGSALIAPSRAQVLDAMPLILGLAARLRASEPVRAGGVAKLRRLLCNGAGPCYCDRQPGALSAALADIERWLGAVE